MKINLNNSKDEAQVQIIPLIDVIFCILTFFLLAALQFSRQEAIRGINLDLSSAKSGTKIPGTSGKELPGTQTQQGESKQGDRFVLYIDPLGQFLDISTPTQTPVPKEQLRSYLENFVKQNPTKPLVLYAARSVSYNDIIETIDLLRQVGGDRVSLAVRANDNEQLAPATGNNLPNQTIPNTIPNNVPNTVAPNLNQPVNPQGNFNPQIPVPGITVPSAGQNISPNIVPLQTPTSGTNNTTPQTPR
jgi:biopolymer transport protein ExbD